MLRERRGAATQAARERFLAGDLSGALAVIDKAVEGAKGGKFADPQMERTLALSRYHYLLRGSGAAGGPDKAAEYGEGLLQRGVYDDAPILLQDIAGQAVDADSPVRPTARLLRLAVMAAERADRAVGGKHALFAATLARAYFLSREQAKAVEAQRRAVRLSVAGAERERAETVLAGYEHAAGG